MNTINSYIITDLTTITDCYIHTNQSKPFKHSMKLTACYKNSFKCNANMWSKNLLIESKTLNIKQKFLGFTTLITHGFNIYIIMACVD